jgi:hypothetical protein
MICCIPEEIQSMISRHSRSQNYADESVEVGNSSTIAAISSIFVDVSTFISITVTTSSVSDRFI